MTDPRYGNREIYSPVGSPKITRPDGSTFLQGYAPSYRMTDLDPVEPSPHRPSPLHGLPRRPERPSWGAQPFGVVRDVQEAASLVVRSISDHPSGLWRIVVVERVSDGILATVRRLRRWSAGNGW